MPSRRSSDQLKHTARNLSNFDNPLNLVDPKMEGKLLLNIDGNFMRSPSRYNNYTNAKPFNNCSFEPEKFMKYVSPSHQRHSDLLSLAKELHKNHERKLSRYNSTSHHISHKKIMGENKFQIVKRNKMNILKKAMSVKKPPRFPISNSMNPSDSKTDFFTN